MSWAPFSKAKLINAINKYNNFSTPGPNKLTWRYLKKIVKNKECINKLIDIANICIDLDHWPSHFKTSTTVIILKPNKTLYDSAILFHPICYDSKLKVLSNETTLVLSNTRELNRVPSTE